MSDQEPNLISRQRESLTANRKTFSDLLANRGKIAQAPEDQLSQHTLSPSLSPDDAYDLDFGQTETETNTNSAPPLPPIEDAKKFNHTTKELIRRIKLKNSEIKKQAGITGPEAEEIDPRIINSNTKMLCELFESGTRLLQDTSPRFYTHQVTGNSPLDDLTKELAPANRMLELIKNTQDFCEKTFQDPPERIRMSFFSAVKHHLQGEQSTSINLLPALEVAYWEMVADVTGGTEGWLAPAAEPSSKTNEPWVSLSKRANSNSKPVGERKKLNYGRPGEEASDNATKQEQANAPKEETTQTDLDAAKREAHSSNRQAHTNLRGRNRATKGALHKLYGALSAKLNSDLETAKNEAKRINPKISKDELLKIEKEILNDRVKSTASFLRDWVQFSIVENKKNESLAIIFSLDDAIKKQSDVASESKEYLDIERNCAELADVLRLVDYSSFLSPSTALILRRLSPSVSHLELSDPNPEMTAKYLKNKIKKD